MISRTASSGDEWSLHRSPTRLDSQILKTNINPCLLITLLRRRLSPVNTNPHLSILRPALQIRPLDLPQRLPLPLDDSVDPDSISLFLRDERSLATPLEHRAQTPVGEPIGAYNAEFRLAVEELDPRFDPLRIVQVGAWGLGEGDQDTALVELSLPAPGDGGGEGLEGRYWDSGSDAWGVEFHFTSNNAAPYVCFGGSGNVEWFARI